MARYHHSTPLAGEEYCFDLSMYERLGESLLKLFNCSCLTLMNV